MSDSLEHELRTHAGALRELARLLVGGQEAEDLVQDTALQALHRPPRRPEGLRGWLLGVLRHRAGKHRRTEQRRQRRERAAPMPDPETTPQRIAEHKETLARLHGALLALPEPYLGTLLLRFFEDLTPTEIAAHTGAALATVKSRLQRGLALLRQRLDEGPGEWRRPLALAFGMDQVLPAGTAAAALGTGVIMASATKLAFSGIVGALVIAAWLWLGSGSSQQTGTRPGDGGATLTGAAAMVEQPDRSIASSPAADAARSEIETPRAEPRPGYLRLCVVRAEDQAPLPGAKVWYVDPDLRKVYFDPDLQTLTSHHLQAKIDCDGNPFATLLRMGRQALTDARGEVDVPQTSFGTRVAATWGERTGLADLAGIAPDGGHLLTLAVRSSLGVVVVHPDGRPAVGAPVAVIYHDQGGGLGGNDHIGPLGLTDREGRLVIREPGALKRGSSTTALGIAAPGLQGIRVPIDPAAPPAQGVLLRLPPTGTVHLLAQDGKGRNVTAEAEIGIQEFSAEGKAGPVCRAVATDVAGRATVAFVGLGLRLRAQAITVPCSVDFAGPATASETVSAVLLPADEAVVVCGRLLTETGVVAADVHLGFEGRATQADGKESGWSTWADTGRAGEFVLCLAGGARATEIRGRLTLLGTLRHVDGRFAEFRIAVSSGVRHHDAGTMQLASPGIVMTGSVVTADQRPVDRAHFEIDRSGPDLQIGGPDLQLAGPRLQQFETLPAPVQVDEEGGFVLFGADGPPPRSLTVTAPDCLPERVPIVPGARDVRVVLKPACALTVEIRYAPELPRPPFRVELTGVGSNEFLNDTGGAQSCKWGPLVPGSYRLVVSLLGTAEPLAERTVTLAATDGGRARRERFDLSDLKTALVSIMSTTGEAVQIEGILLTSAGSMWNNRRALDAFAVRKGTATVILGGPAMSFDVVVAGYAVQHFTGSVADTVLCLQPLPATAVQVTGLDDVPQDCRVTLVAIDADRADFVVRSEGMVGFGPGLLARFRSELSNGKCRLGLCRACRLQCELELRRGDWQQKVPLQEASWTPGKESMDLAVDPALLRAALERLR